MYNNNIHTNTITSNSYLRESRQIPTGLEIILQRLRDPVYLYSILRSSVTDDEVIHN